MAVTGHLPVRLDLRPHVREPEDLLRPGVVQPLCGVPDGRWGRRSSRRTGLLWVTRFVLLVAVGLHIWAATSLTLQNRRARPVGYRELHPVELDYAARTMRMSGYLLAVYIIYHLMHLTFGSVHRELRPLRSVRERGRRLSSARRSPRSTSSRTFFSAFISITGSGASFNPSAGVIRPTTPGAGRSPSSSRSW